MLTQLHSYLDNKDYFVFDFDRTLAKMEIDWSTWHEGIAEIYAKYDPNHGYTKGENPHLYHNQLVATFGEPLLREARQFNSTYESKHLTGFTPNSQAVQFIQENPTPTFYVYSSNARPTVLKGLEYLGILDRIKTIISKDDVTFVKPNPEGFFLLDGFADNQEKFLMIGDSDSDRDAAKAAGIDFLECTMFEKYHEEESPPRI